MKRWLSLLLCAVLFAQCSGLDAFAESGIISKSALNAAYALSGQGDDAAQWHPGMLPEDNWNAEQLDQWLGSVLDNEFHSVQNAFADMEVTLEKIRVQEPSLYAELTSGENAAYAEAAMALRVQVEAMREQLRTARNQLIQKADVIANASDQLARNDIDENAMRLYSYQTNEAVSSIRQNRALVTANASNWLDQIDDWHGLFTGQRLGAASADAGLSAWIRRVMDWREPAENYTLSASVMTSGGSTRLSKLGVSKSALSGELGGLNIHVMSDKEFAITLTYNTTDAEGKTTSTPVSGGWVTLVDMYSASGFSESLQTGDDGNAMFNVSKYQLDADGNIHVAVQAEAEGYRLTALPMLTIKKGGKATVSLQKDDGKPYFVAMTFNDTDMLNSQREVKYSPYNDVWHEIKAAVVYPDGYKGTSDVTLSYYDADQLEWRTQTKAASDGEAYTLRSHDGKALNARQFTWKDQWKRILGPGKTVSFFLGAKKGDVACDSMLTVTRGDVDKPFTDATGLVMTQITDSLGGLGNLFSIKLPSSFPKVLAGAQLSLNIPFVENLPKIGYDIDGTLTVAYGIDLGKVFPGETGEEGKSWRDDNTWKTEDQKEIDARVKKAQKSGKMAAYKAKVGAAWDGVKSLDVKVLGTVSASFGAFAMITSRFYKSGEYKDPDGDYYHECHDVGMMIGGIFTISAEWAAQWAIFNGAIGLSASAALGISLGLEWDNFQIKDPSYSHVRLAKGMTGVTIMIKFMLYVSVGVGIRGIAGISVTGYGYISVLLQFTASATIPHVKVTAGAGVYALVEIFIVKIKKNIWVSPEFSLYESDPMGDGVDLSAKSAKNADVSEDAMPMEAERYPALVPEAEAVMKDVPIAAGKVSFIDVGEQTFAFYISDDNGKNRVTWYNLDTGRTGTVQKILEDVRGVEAHIQPADMQDFDFCVSGIETVYSVNDLETGNMAVLGALCASGFEEETVELDGETSTVKAPRDSTLYYMVLTGDGADGLKLFWMDGVSWPYYRAYDVASVIGYVAGSIQASLRGAR